MIRPNVAYSTLGLFLLQNCFGKTGICNGRFHVKQGLALDSRKNQYSKKGGFLND